MPARFAAFLLLLLAARLTTRDRVRLTFDPGDGVPDLVLRAGANSGLELAGRDGKFAPASEEVRAHAAPLRAAGIPEPVAIRSAWHGNPPATLFHQAGWPATPFRADAPADTPR